MEERAAGVTRWWVGDVWVGDVCGLRAVDVCGESALGAVGGVGGFKVSLFGGT